MNKQIEQAEQFLGQVVERAYEEAQEQKGFELAKLMEQEQAEASFDLQNERPFKEENE